MGAYFNTYYNAETAFAEAETAVLAARTPAQIENPLGGPSTVPGDARNKFTLVVEKASKLLQYHPNSSLVDDALMMIGKSYAYQGDYQRAERKFKELIDAYPDGGLTPEARLLQAECFYRMTNRAQAEKLARELAASEAARGDEFILNRVSLLEAQIALDANDLRTAAGHLATAAENAPDATARTIAWRRLGDVRMRAGDPEGAAEAYRQAYSAAPDYVAEYRARSGEAAALDTLGRYDEALDLLDGMLENTNNKEFFPELDFQYARTLRNSGRIDEALDHYRFVDTAYARTEAAAKSYFDRGMIYEKLSKQYDSALAAYTRGKGEAPQAPVSEQLNRRAEFLSAYFRLTREIAEGDSALQAALAPLPDSILQMPDSLRALLPPRPDPDTLRARMAVKKSELAGLFYFGIGDNDSAVVWYRTILREYPSSPMVPRSLYTIAQIVSGDSVGGRQESDSLYGLLVDRYPDSPFAGEAARLTGRTLPARANDPAEALYWGAERTLRAGNVRAAIDSFRVVARTGGSSPYVPRALFAIGLLYENLAPQPDSAVANYRRLVAGYPSSQFAALAKPKLDDLDAARLAAARQDSTARVSPPAVGPDSSATAPRPPEDVPPVPPPGDTPPKPDPVRKPAPPEGEDTKPPPQRIR